MLNVLSSSRSPEQSTSTPQAQPHDSHWTSITSREDQGGHPQGIRSWWHPAQPPRAQVQTVTDVVADHTTPGNNSLSKREGMVILTNLRSRCGGLPHSGIWFNGIKIQIQQAGSLLEGPRGIKLGSSEEEKQYER